MAGRLRAKQIPTLRPGRHGDGGTLFLVVEPSGRSRHWVQRLTVHGKRRDLGLGGYPYVGLAEARAAAFANRQLARRGGDPTAVVRQSRAPTFRTASERVEAGATWKGRGAENRRRALERYCGSIMDRRGQPWPAAPPVPCAVRRPARRTHDTVLCIQDGTRLNFTRRADAARDLRGTRRHRAGGGGVAARAQRPRLAHAARVLRAGELSARRRGGRLRPAPARRPPAARHEGHDERDGAVAAAPALARSPPTEGASR